MLVSEDFLCPGLVESLFARYSKTRERVGWGFERVWKEWCGDGQDWDKTNVNDGVWAYLHGLVPPTTIIYVVSLQPSSGLLFTCGILIEYVLGQDFHYFEQHKTCAVDAAQAPPNIRRLLKIGQFKFWLMLKVWEAQK